jgi:hypothetical protein
LRRTNTVARVALAFAEFKQILQQHQDQLNQVARELVKHETLDAQTCKDLIKPSPVAARRKRNDASMKETTISSGTGSLTRLPALNREGHFSG